MRITEEEFRRILRRLGCEERLGDLFLYADSPANLESEKRALLEKHLSTCENCRQVLALAQVHLYETSQDKFPDWIIELAGQYRKTNVPRKGIKDLKEKAVSWLSQAWTPRFAGVPLTASEVSDQFHVFKAPDGEIQVSCRWGGKHGHKPAYVFIAWNASIQSGKELCVRFANPDTGETMAEVRLGTALEGETTINSKKLGFDPSETPWNMQLVLE
jgi:hypothetical protein